MGSIFGTLLNASGSQPAPADDDSWYGRGRGYQQVGMRTNSGKRVNAELAQRVSAVYACRSILERSLGSIPVQIMRRGTARPGDPTGLRQQDMPALGNPLYDLLAHNPNAWQTPFDFRAMLQGHLAMRGNAYAQILPGPLGPIGRLEPIHPDRVVQIDRLPDSTLRYRLNDGTALLTGEIMHLRGPHAPGGIYGVSPIDYAMETVGLALSAEEHGARTFRNGARPSGVASVKGRLSDVSYERVKKELNGSQAGVANSSRTLLLEEGMTFTPTMMTADDLQFLQTRAFSIEEICRWWDIPPVMLHSLSKSTSFGSGIESIMQAFVRLNLSSWLTIWEETIARDLILAPQIYYAKFDTESLLRGDSAALSNYIARLALCGVLTRNEGRAMLGYGPLDGLDEPLTPSNTATSDALPQNGGGSGDGGGGGQDGEDDGAGSTKDQALDGAGSDIAANLLLDGPADSQPDARGR